MKFLSEKEKEEKFFFFLSFNGTRGKGRREGEFAICGEILNILNEHNGGVGNQVASDANVANRRTSIGIARPTSCFLSHEH